MDITELLTVERVACHPQVSSKKRLLEQVSTLIADTNPSLGPGEVFESLIARERLGSTGLGRGVAIPHGRVKNSDRTIGAFVKLAQGVDYDAVDGEPVDLLFGLLVPEESTEEHLKLLALLARMFSDTTLVASLRSAPDQETIHKLLTGWQSGG